MNWITPSTYTNPVYAYKRSADQDKPTATPHTVVIVGAGPVGLCAALDLAAKGIKSVVLSKENSVSVGSRAICFSKKTLEIINRVHPQAFERMMNKGVTWNLGKVFYQQEKVYEFNLLAEQGHKIPAFINLQQYYFEEYLVDAVHEHPLIDLRWQHELIDHSEDQSAVYLTVKTPENNYALKTDYLLACDGVHSPIRKRMKLAFEGQAFEENFLIADIVMHNDYPAERWFWFDPPFNPGYSALLHKQPDNVWRIDMQLGWNIDKEKELEPERIKNRLRQMLGENISFDLEWTSIYQFRCMRMSKFVHNRIIFAGDAAHLVSPFGARGANGGIQDIDNLVWKLAYVIKQQAAPSLLTTYDEERSPATDENIFHSSNATDFISPKSEMSLAIRNATLDLAKKHHFAQSMVNSGRLSHAYRYVNSSLVTTNTTNKHSNWQVGYPLKDCLLYKAEQPVYLIDQLGPDFTLLIDGTSDIVLQADVKIIQIGKDLIDKESFFKQAYNTTTGNWILIRPDHYIAATGHAVVALDIQQALARSIHAYNPKQKQVKDQYAPYAKDAKYQELIAAHKGLSLEQSTNLNIKILLKLMHHIDDPKVFKSLIEELKE